MQCSDAAFIAPFCLSHVLFPHTLAVCNIYTLHPHTLHYEQTNICIHKCLITHHVMTVRFGWEEFRFID